MFSNPLMYCWETMLAVQHCNYQSPLDSSPSILRLYVSKRCPAAAHWSTWALPHPSSYVILWWGRDGKTTGTGVAVISRVAEMRKGREGVNLQQKKSTWLILQQWRFICCRDAADHFSCVTSDITQKPGHPASRQSLTNTSENSFCHGSQHIELWIWNHLLTAPKVIN